MEHLLLSCLRRSRSRVDWTFTFLASSSPHRLPSTFLHASLVPMFYLRLSLPLSSFYVSPCLLSPYTLPPPITFPVLQVRPLLSFIHETRQAISRIKPPNSGQRSTDKFVTESNIGSITVNLLCSSSTKS